MAVEVGRINVLETRGDTRVVDHQALGDGP